MTDAAALDQFFTQPALAARVAEWAGIGPGMRVLEPGCGDGALVRAALARGAHVTAIEIDQALVDEIQPHPHLELSCGDFLRSNPGPHDLALMNPAYGEDTLRRPRDGLHVARALALCPRVVAIVRANFLWGGWRLRRVLCRCWVARAAILVHRPDFPGPALPGIRKSTGPRHDFSVLDLRAGRSWGTTALEWWDDYWD